MIVIQSGEVRAVAIQGRSWQNHGRGMVANANQKLEIQENVVDGDIGSAAQRAWPADMEGLVNLCDYAPVSPRLAGE